MFYVTFIWYRYKNPSGAGQFGGARTPQFTVQVLSITVFSTGTKVFESDISNNYNRKDTTSSPPPSSTTANILTALSLQEQVVAISTFSALFEV